MANAIDYLIKVNFAFTLLFLVHHVLFRHQKFLNINRFFLLSIIFLSLVLPALPTADLNLNLAETFQPSTRAEEAFQPDNSNTQPTNNSPVNGLSPRDNNALIIGIYLAVVVILLVRFAMQLRTIISTIKYAQQRKADGFIYCHPILATQPFSFFHFIILPNEECDREKYQQIKLHEEVHVRQFHTIDVLLTKIFAIALWANPLVYLFQKQVKLNLEFLADNATIENGVNVQNYQLNLIRHYNNAAAPQSVNTFFSSKLKQRVVMMNRAQPKMWKAVRYILILPIIALASAIVGLKTETLPHIRQPQVHQEIAVLPTKPKEKNNGEQRFAPTEKTVRKKQVVSTFHDDKQDVYINATSDTVRIELIPNPSKTAKSYEGIYSIDNKIMSDQEIRDAIKKSGNLEIVMARRPVIGVYGKNDSVAIKKWGKKANNGVVFLETPDY